MAGKFEFEVSVQTTVNKYSLPLPDYWQGAKVGNRVITCIFLRANRSPYFVFLT